MTTLKIRLHPSWYMLRQELKKNVMVLSFRYKFERNSWNTQNKLNIFQLVWEIIYSRLAISSPDNRFKAFNTLIPCVVPLTCSSSRSGTICITQINLPCQTSANKWSKTFQGHTVTKKRLSKHVKFINNQRIAKYLYSTCPTDRRAVPVATTRSGANEKHLQHQAGPSRPLRPINFANTNFEHGKCNLCGTLIDHTAHIHKCIVPGRRSASVVSLHHHA